MIFFILVLNRNILYEIIVKFLSNIRDDRMRENYCNTIKQKFISILCKNRESSSKQ